MTARRADLRSRMTSAATRRTEVAPPAAETAVRTKPARVTLNLPPSLMREVSRWADDAAAALDVPRVSTQDAMRAMIRAVMTDSNATGIARSLLRAEQD